MYDCSYRVCNDFLRMLGCFLSGLFRFHVYYYTQHSECTFLPPKCFPTCVWPLACIVSLCLLSADLQFLRFVSHHYCLNNNKKLLLSWGCLWSGMDGEGYSGNHVWPSLCKQFFFWDLTTRAQECTAVTLCTADSTRGHADAALREAPAAPLMWTVHKASKTAYRSIFPLQIVQFYSLLKFST